MRLTHVQVDILARTPDGLLTIIEVKLQSRRNLARLPRAQLERLLRVADGLACLEPVELKLALVEGNKVRLLPVDALTDF